MLHDTSLTEKSRKLVWTITKGLKRRKFSRFALRKSFTTNVRRHAIT